MKKFIITDLAKGNATITADQVLEIGGGGGTTGDFIPLTGTEEDKPVTGDIEFTKNSYDKGFKQINEETDVENKINFRLESGVFITSNRPNEGLYNAFAITANGQFSINSNNPTSKGFRGTAYYGANYDDNTYVQKKYVDDPETLITVLNNANSTQLATIKGLLGIV